MLVQPDKIINPAQLSNSVFLSPITQEGHLEVAQDTVLYSTCLPFLLLSLLLHGAFGWWLVKDNDLVAAKPVRTVEIVLAVAAPNSGPPQATPSAPLSQEPAKPIDSPALAKRSKAKRPPKKTAKPIKQPKVARVPALEKSEQAVRSAPLTSDTALADEAPSPGSRGITDPAAPRDKSSQNASGPTVAASFHAHYLENPKPPYPAVARQRGWEGDVKLRVHVLENGFCDQVLIDESSGHDSLDEAALETVKKWRFVPAKRGDTPIISWVIVPITFKLNN